MMVMTMINSTLSVMTASIKSSSRVSPSLQTAAERNGTCNNKLRYIYLDKNGCNGDGDNHDKDDFNENDDDRLNTLRCPR